MDRVIALRRRERIIAVVRWVGVAFMVVQVSVYEAPGPQFVDAAARVRPAGYAVAAALGVVCVAVEVVLRTTTSQRRLMRWGVAFLAADVAAVMTIVYLYSFDPVSATWAIMTILPLEGALRLGLVGALGVWTTAALLYPLREAYAAAAYGFAFEIPSVIFRLGLLLVIALFAGFMARDLDVQLRLLQHLNSASQQLASRLDPAEILQTLCEQAHACLPLRSAVVHAYDGSSLTPVARWPSGSADEADGAGEDPELAHRVLSGPLWVEGDASRPARLVVPLRWQAGPVGHILVVRPRGVRLRAFERAAAASLAESAALALATTRIIESERRISRRLRYLEALRTRFVATLAHDLRLPLTVFKGVSGLLQTRRQAIAPERIDELLETAERQSHRLLRLADDLLDAARLDADHLVVQPAPCELAAVVAATVADIEEVVAVDVPADLVVLADAARLERILWNLLSNAEKYGRAPIEVSAHREGDTALVSVRDHGSGLHDEQRSRLFADFAGSDDPASVGLGLAIVWQLVHAHGGTVTYHDARPGARFTVSLPVAGSPADGDGDGAG